MPKRNLAWMLVIFLVVLLFWTLPGTLASRDSLYRAFGPLVAVRAQIQKHYVEETDDQELLEGAIRGMVAQLDRFSHYIAPEEYPEFRDREKEGIFNGVGIVVDLLEGWTTVVSPIEDTPAFYAGIGGGDRIVEIDGQSTKGLSLTQAVNSIKGPPGTMVQLKVVDSDTGELREVKLRRARINIVSVKGYARTAEGKWSYMIDEEHRIGYIRVSTFVESTVPMMQEALRELREGGVRGVVLDLRFNPGGLLESAVDMASCFVRDGLIVSTRGRRSDEKNWYANPEAMIADIPVVVLINGSSASASEIVAGALQDHQRATIVGERSFGKGSVQNILELEGHGAIKLTTAYYYLPSGRRIHHSEAGSTLEAGGIVPDIEVPLTEEQTHAVIEGRRRADSASPDEVSAAESVEETGRSGLVHLPHSILIDPQLEQALAALQAQLEEPVRLESSAGSKAFPRALPRGERAAAGRRDGQVTAGCMPYSRESVLVAAD